MDAATFIADRRDRKTHSAEDIAWFAKAAARSEIPDYQIAAWLMAAFLNPLSEQETVDLTLGMAHSGETLDLSSLPKPWVDKHSTGGVGDKTTIVLLPLLAACGVTMVKMSGRGLGITGGTVDKLASIPGFRTNLTPAEMILQAAKIGIGFSGQTPKLAPADAVLYALRDATSTIESVPLIVSSILSKKLAGGADTVCLDVKCGSGAFMKDLGQARTLADWLEKIGTKCGLHIRASVTDMEIPLGRAVGNRIEVQEAIRTLNGEQSRFADLCRAFAAEALVAALAIPEAEAQERIGQALASWAAAHKCREWFGAQGADPDLIAHPEKLELSSRKMQVAGPTGKWVERLDAETVGKLALDLGAGRHTKESDIDPKVGIFLTTHFGEQVQDTLAEIYLPENGTMSENDARARLLEAYGFSDRQPPERPLFI